MNEQFYETASPKILFIAKEPNNPKQEAGDFREWWKEELNHPFSYRIAEWSYGMLNSFPQYDEIWKEKRGHNAMQQIAFMNIKKIGGGGNAEYDEMLKHVEMNFKFLHRQIEIIDPDIIITGTTWGELRNALFPDIQWKSSGYYVEIGIHNEAKVIDFYHPSSRTAPAASYSLLQNIISSEKFKEL